MDDGFTQPAIRYCVRDGLEGPQRSCDLATAGVPLDAHGTADSRAGPCCAGVNPRCFSRRRLAGKTSFDEKLREHDLMRADGRDD